MREAWHDANESREPMGSRPEELRGAAEQAGLASAAGLLAVGVLGPMAARRGARSVIGAAGRQSDDALQKVKKAADEADDVTKMSDEAFREAAAEATSSKTERFRAAAARAERSGGKVNLTRFAGDVGIKGPERAERGAKRYRRFKQRAAEEGQSTLGRFMERNARGQRRLLASASQKVKKELMVEGPGMFALDYALGAPSEGDRHAAYDVMGHAQEAIEYMPTFATYELGARGGMLLGSAMMKTGMRAAQNFLKESDAATEAVTKGFAAMEGAKRGAQRAATEISNRYQQNIEGRPASVETAKEAARQAREFISQTAKQAEKALQGKGGMSRDPTSHSETLAGVEDVMTAAEGAEESSFVSHVKDAGQDIKGLRAAKKRLQVGDEEESLDPVARALGGKAATIEDVRQADNLTLTDEASQSLGRLEEKVERAKQTVERQPESVTDEALEMVRGMEGSKTRVSGYAKFGGEVRRVPTTGDLRQTAGQALDRATRIYRPGSRDSLSVFEILGGHNLTRKRPAVRSLSGGMDVEGLGSGSPHDMFYFGTDEPKTPGDSEVHQFDRGLAVMDSPGASTGTIYGDGQARAQGFISPRSVGGDTKMHRLRMRRHRTTATTREESIQAQQTRGAGFGENAIVDNVVGAFQSVKESLSLGAAQGENTAFQRLKSTLGPASPRRLFAEESSLWNVSMSRAGQEEATPVADAVYATRQAMRNATAAYTKPGVFSKTARNAVPEGTIEKLGGVDEILRSDEKALKAAESVLDRLPSDSALQAPSANQARKIVEEARGNLDQIYGGSNRGQQLRRFISEQGALGTRQGGGITGEVRSMVDDMQAQGKLSDRAALEAKAGMVNLEIQQQAGTRLTNPYEELASQSGPYQSETLTAAQEVLQQNRSTLEEFGRSRDRVDFSYHRKAFTEPDHFGAPFEETGSFAMQGGPLSGGKLLAESGLETSRRALSSVGLGWNPQVSLTSNKGLREVGKLWAKRGAAVVGGALAYRAADTATDAALPEDAPLGEGITMAGADIAANAATTASHVYDALGVTGAAQYMEGLMPKSTSTLPGAAAGYYAAGWTGAIAGAAVNRATQTTMSDTPFEGLSIAPPLAPFVSDMTESAEQTEAEYQGRKWVPQRKGRFFMLSGTPYEGERIEQYRPNWYTRQKSQYKETPVLYGSKTEAALFKDLPLIDFAPGDIFDPQYLEKTNRESRPYHSPSVPFSDIPLIGPTVGKYAGRAYNAIHPMASNRPRHMEDIVGSFRGEKVGSGPSQISGNYPSAAVGTPASGYQSFGKESKVIKEQGDSAYVEGETIVGGNSPSATLDEQFYRLSEAMGFTGFVGQQAVGGEGIFRRPRYKSASRMDSTARAFHDLKMGDMLGVGEAIRRLYPFERGGETAQGPRNTMAQWMPGEEANTDFKHSDPYCLAEDCLMEIDGELIPAEEAYERVKGEEGEHYTRTHRGNYKDIEAAAEREVDEKIVEIEVQGLPWTLRVTGEHPVLVKNGKKPEWWLAKNIKEGDTLLEPFGPGDPDNIVTYYSDHGEQPYTRTRDASGPLMRALRMLMKAEPPETKPVRMNGLDRTDRFYLNRGFEMGGTKRNARDKKELADLRRRMAEFGFPEPLPGIPAGVVRVLVGPWIDDIDRDEGSLTINLTPNRIGRSDREEWQMRDPYEPDRSVEETMRQAAYRLLRVLTAADVPSKLSFPEPGQARFKLEGNPVTRLTHTAEEQRKKMGGVHRFRGGMKSTHWKIAEGRKAECVMRDVVSIRRVEYEGPVYSFQVAGDKSFVAAGVATHNSKVAMGEALLPGEGMEATGAVGYGETALEAKDLGRDVYGTSLRMLGIKGRETSDRKKWAKRQAKKRMLDMGAAVRTEAVYVDEEKKVTAVADAATQGNNPIHIKALSKAKFRQTNQPRELDTMQMNATLGAADQARGMIAYVNEETGETRTFTQNFDSSLYQKSVRKMQAARSLAKKYADKGYGAKGALYSPTDRMRVLMNADPFGDQWQVERKKAEALYASGNMEPRAKREFEKIARNHDKMRLPFEMYPDRFGSADKVMNPPEKQANLTYNENVESAAQYSLPERAAGAVWSSATSVRTPLHTKFFGNYNMQEQYENRVLLDRDYQSWSQPVDDFVKPYMRGLAAADDPLQGALSYGIGGATFGGPAFGAIGAITGSVYGTGRGAYESAAGSTYVPEEKEELREVNRRFDRMQYYRAKRLYDATGAQKYREKMQNTAIGWTQQGLEGEGWAKSRRRSYSPEERMDSELFGGDRGFNSPYRGLSKVDDFSGAIRRHDETALSLGKGVNKMDDLANASLERMGDTARAFARPPRTPPPPASIRPRSGPPRPAPSGETIKGLPETGYAGALRRHNTSKGPGSGRGFGSPYQGQDPEGAVQYDAQGDPTQSPIPPEMLTMYNAAPRGERDFIRAGLLAEDPDQQAAMLRMVSPDFAAMMDVGWNYLHGQQRRGYALSMDPMEEMNRDLASHPVMGPGADPESAKIRTLQDRGLEARDAGLGWQGQMERLEDAVVEAQPVSASMGDSENVSSEEDLRNIIKTTLAQMGIRGEVSIEPSSAPTEIHIRQRSS